jgi:5-methylcytosine-specific restriction endonuclease McrA
MSQPVYVLHQDNTPLMPTTPAKARHLLKAGKAVVCRHQPFTIRLTVPSDRHVQPITVGVDMGAKTAGVAATGNGRVLYQGEVYLRDDIRRRMDRRRMYRRSRRSRKCRYRAPRFNNRAASRRKGRLPPSIQSKVDTTIKVVRRVAAILPVVLIRVEVANFDTQAMRAKRSKLACWAYQRGEQFGWENTKMYVRARDRYTCQYCGTVVPPNLEVDHIVPRSRGGSNRPDNLVAACRECNQRKGNLTATEFGYPRVAERAKKPLRTVAHTQAGKTATLEGLAKIASVETTYGYITKLDREALGLPKTHYYDAVAIAAGGEPVETLSAYEAMRAVAKGAYRQRRGDRSRLVASLPCEVFGFRQWDKVRLPDGRLGFVKGRRSSGYFAISDLNGTLIAPSTTYKRLQLVERGSTLLTEMREAASPSDTSEVSAAEIL